MQSTILKPISLKVYSSSGASLLWVQLHSQIFHKDFEIFILVVNNQSETKKRSKERNTYKDYLTPKKTPLKHAIS